MEKLSEKWRLYELFCQYSFEKICKEGRDDKIKKKIENIINKDSDKIVEFNEHKLSEDLLKFRNQFIHSEFGKVNLLGPIGKECLYSMGFLIDLDDISEVYLDAENYSGCINSKTCGWIAWQLVKGDKSLIKKLSTKYQYIISKNNHKWSSSIENLHDKLLRFEKEKKQRHLKRFFSDAFSFWYHKDQRDLWNELPHTKVRNDWEMRMALISSFDHSSSTILST